MIMEFVEGHTLSAKLSSAPITLATGLGYIQQVLSGLAYAHERGIVHRDVKPSNIMISRGGHVKLLDFGLALPTLGPEFTRSGMILGTLPFVSPEQILGKQLDARSDVYSVGVTLYQLLTGRLPFEATSEYEIASAHLNSSPADPATVNPNIPVPLSKIVLKSLSKSPGDRFQTAKEFLDSLSLLHTGETTTLAASALPRQPIDANVLDSVSRDLAYHVGPIAKVIVSRAAKRAISLDELYKLLATEISTEKSRQDFLATRIKYSTPK